MSMPRSEAQARIKDLSDAIRILDNAKKPMEEERRALWNALSAATERRCNALTQGHVLGARFGADELTFAAASRCDCGAGLAYPNDIGPRGFWDCSAILLGVADSAVKHTARLPFTFYEIKSEGQPSARGLTTRPS